MHPDKRQALSGLKVQPSQICVAANEPGQKVVRTKPALPPTMVSAPVKPPIAPPLLV